MPVNAFLIDMLSKWNKLFYLCFKINEVEKNLKQIKSNDLIVTVDKCNCIYLLNIFQNLKFDNKLKAGFISLQKGVVQIFKNLKQKDLNEESSGSDRASHLNADNDAFNIDKPLIQMNIENCIVYRGFISSSKYMPSSSRQNRKSTISSHDQLIFDSDNCLTIYHLLDQQLYLISFTNRLDCIRWYFNLFKSRHYPDTYSLYKSDTFPNVKPNVPMQSRNSLMINNSSSTNEANSKKMFDIFKKK